MKSETDIVVSLDKLERLFVELPFALDQPGLPTGPAIEQVICRLRSSRLPRAQIKLIVQLTSQSVTPELKNSGETALREFCRQQAVNNRQTSQTIRHAGWLSLRIGMAILALALVFSTLFEHFRPLPDILNRLFSEGFLILGWVVLWHPLETLLYDWVLPYRTARIYEHLRQAELILVSKTSHDFTLMKETAL
jgi:hypothetical protein